MYTIIDLGVLAGCKDNSPQAINSQSQVTGTAYFANDRNHSYIWEQGNLRSLGTLGGTECNVNGLADTGQIVGWSTTAQGYTRAFLWQKEQMSDLSTLGGRGSSALALNNHGQIVGTADTPDGKSHGVLWDKAGIHDVSALLPPDSLMLGINDQEQILVDKLTGGRRSSYLLDHGKLTPIQIKQSTYCLANYLNNQGFVVGWYNTDNQSRDAHAFLWQNEQVTDLGTLGGPSSSALCINANNQIVGTASVDAEESHAFFWQEGKMQDLNDLVPQESGWVLESADGINNAGEIIGTGTSDGVVAAFLLVPVK